MMSTLAHIMSGNYYLPLIICQRIYIYLSCYQLNLWNLEKVIFMQILCYQ